MGWGSFLSKTLRFLGPVGAGVSLLLDKKGNSKPKDPLQQFLDTLNPYLQKQNQASDEFLGYGRQDLQTARDTLADPMNYFKSILGGSRDEALATIDASSISQGLDDDAKRNLQYGLRGGNRAAEGATLDFDKTALFNKLIQEAKSGAASGLSQIGSIFAGLGTSEANLGLGEIDKIIQSLFGVQEFREAGKDRKTDLINGILGAAGSFLGFFACVTEDTLIETYDEGSINVKDVTPDTFIMGKKEGTNGEFGVKDVPLILIFKRIREGVRTFRVETKNGFSIRCTKSHYFVTSLVPYKEAPLSELKTGDFIETIKGKSEIRTIVENAKLESIVELKFNSTKSNYIFCSNGILSVDGDCEPSK